MYGLLFYLLEDTVRRAIIIAPPRLHVAIGKCTGEEVETRVYR